MKIKIDDIRKCLFYIAYTTFLTFSMLGHVSFLASPLKLLSSIGLVLFAISIFLSLKKYKKTELGVLIVLSILSLVLIIKNNDYAFFKVILFVAAFKDMDFDKITKYDFKIRLGLSLATFIMLGLGMIPDITFTAEGGLKHSYGFTNPNTLAMHLLIICFDFIYINKKNLSFFKMVMLILATILIDNFTGSRSVTYVLIVFCLLLGLYKYKTNWINNKFVKFFITNSVLILAVFTLIFSVMFLKDNVIVIKINDVLSNRIGNIAFASERLDINLFGNDISVLGRTLDSMYAYSLYAYGVIWFVIIIYCFKQLFVKLYDEKNYLLIVIMFTFIIYGLSERLWLCVDYNVFILLFSKLFLENVLPESKDTKDNSSDILKNIASKN